MAVDLLDAPLRVSWDLFSNTKSSLSDEQLLHIAAELTAAGVFFVTLEHSPLNHPAIIPLLDSLLKGGCQVSLLIDADAQQVDKLSSVPSGVQLFIDGAACVANDRLDGPQLAGFLRQIRDLQFDPALLWIPRRGQLSLIPDFLDFCQQNGVSRFKLPNQKIDANSEQNYSDYLPDCDDLQQFSTLLKRVGLPKIPTVQLEVHDLFLWELLQPLCGGERSEYGGCQAANSLGYVNSLGDLLPCSSWPQSLGSLLESELYDLWQSAARIAVREQIAQLPAGCDGCHDYQICFGGCRGLSSFCRDDALGRDLLCAEQR